jgi:chromosome segregation ATPase
MNKLDLLCRLNHIKMYLTKYYTKDALCTFGDFIDLLIEDVKKIPEEAIGYERSATQWKILKSDLEKQIKENDIIRQKKEFYLIELDKSILEIDRLKEEKETLTKLCAETTGHLREYDNINTRLLTQVDDIATQKNKLLEEKKELENSNEKLLIEIESLENRIIQLENEMKLNDEQLFIKSIAKISDFNEHIDYLVDINKKLNIKCNDFENSNEKLLRENEKLQKDVNHFGGKMNEEASEATKLCGENQVLKLENQILKEHFYKNKAIKDRYLEQAREELEEKIDEINDENDDLKEEVENLKLEKENFKTRLDSLVQSYIKQVAGLEKQVEHLKSRLNEYGDLNSRLYNLLRIHRIDFQY